MTTLSSTQGLTLGQAGTQSITVSGISTTGALTTLTIPATSTTNAQWMSRLKVEPGLMNSLTPNLIPTNAMNSHNVGNTVTVSSSNVGNNPPALTLDCYEDMFKEITKKLYGTEDALALMVS